MEVLKIMDDNDKNNTFVCVCSPPPHASSYVRVMVLIAMTF
jgi:hypothetical protein